MVPSTHSTNPRHSVWSRESAKFLITIAATVVAVQTLFLVDISYLNGALYHEAERVHNLKVLLVDFDQGSIGNSLRSAADNLQTATVPSVKESSPIEYPEIGRGITNNDTSMEYDASNVLTYIYNSARYAATIQGYIEPNIQKLVSETQAVYLEDNGSQNLQVAGVNTNAVSALFHPIGSTASNMKQTEQGARTIYNTIGLVYPILMQFFFVLAFNMICGQNKLFGRWSLCKNYMFRTAVAFAYAFIGAVCASGLIFAFQDGWGLDVSQYFLAVLVFWLYMHIDLLYTDVVTAFVPVKFVPFFIFSFVIFNVTSLLVPFELSPGFYKIGYAAPAHETYQILIQIWSGGNDRLYQALPILFAWEVLLTPLAIIGMQRRCYAAIQMAKSARARVEDREKV
ncbi:hypothetical protein E4T43_09309 [Aureobasidium subglaciale]|nr:hypothetical protein E4T43_09309 [Aureobasidium subglaciale]